MARKFNFSKVLPHAGGLAVGALGVKITDKMLGNLAPNVRNLAQIGVGLIGPVLIKAKPGSFVESVGDGMIAVGAYKMLEKIPALQGLYGVDDLDESIGETGYIVDSEISGEINGVDDLNESIGEIDELLD